MEKGQPDSSWLECRLPVCSSWLSSFYRWLLCYGIFLFISGLWELERWSSREESPLIIVILGHINQFLKGTHWQDWPIKPADIHSSFKQCFGILVSCSIQILMIWILKTKMEASESVMQWASQICVCVPLRILFKLQLYMRLSGLWDDWVVCCYRRWSHNLQELEWRTKLFST